MGEINGKLEREKKKERERRNSRVRSSHFSLEFPVIGPSNPGEARGKVDLHCKSYEWAPILWSFNKLREVGALRYRECSGRRHSLEAAFEKKADMWI